MKYNDKFKFPYFDLHNDDLEKIRTSTRSHSCLTLFSLNTRSVSRKFETFQMDISKLSFDISGLVESSLSSDIEMLQHVHFFDLLRNNCSISVGGVLLYGRDTFNAKTKLRNFL